MNQNKEIKILEKKKEKEIISINKQKIKEYKRQLKSEMFDLENELSFNENGEAQLNCYIGNSKDIFSKYDIVQDRTITDEFHHYLMDETEIIPIRYNLELRMHVNDDFTQENEKHVKKALKRYYSFKITSDTVKMKRTNFRCFLLFFLGIICLSLIPLVSIIETKLPIYETLLILTWFFLWEGTGTKLFDSAKIKTHKYNMLRLYNANVVFIRKKDEKSNINNARNKDTNNL